MADDVCPLEPDDVQPAREPGAPAVRRRSPAWPREIERVDAAMSGERRQQWRPPAPRAGEPVDEHDRVAAARDREARDATVDLDGLGLQCLSTSTG
jgi:hypothetical protein